MTEALGSADPTLFQEIKQLNGGKTIPIIGTSAAISPAFFKSSAQAVGAADLAANFHADNLVTETSGPAYTAFSAALLAQQGKVPGADRRLHHLPERAGRRAPVRRDQPGRARDDQVRVHRPERLQP